MKLEPCPCCGSTDIQMESSVSMRHYFVECQECGLATAGWASPEHSMKKWNQRTLPPAVQEALNKIHVYADGIAENSTDAKAADAATYIIDELCYIAKLDAQGGA